MSDLARRPGPSRRVKVVEHPVQGAASRSREDRVITEEPLEIRLGWPGSPPSSTWITMRTPGQDFELAAGWALHEGLTIADGIVTVAYCTDATLDPEQEFNVVTLSLRSPPRRLPSPGHRHLSTGSSACGVCGSDSIAKALDTPRVPRWEGPAPSVDLVRALPAALRPHQRLFARTGGVHAAALVDAAGEFLVVREDVGRHNAVDKVTGARVLAGEPTAEALLVTSGRAGFEVVQKAAAAGVGSLVAVGAPTSLAVDLAVRSGLRLYGFTDAARTVQYA
ncbi:formate dehydrogenase accessory sulfurtransferase FdhD [Nocardioides gilvus]|uniref:formate dehydrogenase accessory sulfurtransferase FdhD n=1 Tax=Nocardioides gilvus TaxID=1735589 RepID=UPI001EF58942|nr:formate dehydrogenase accessory sulfurtransferase FdhD [Nocardioides gilvus]